jgi:prepilin-type N-terminal cleavage/methylation domain-containing protein
LQNRFIKGGIKVKNSLKSNGFSLIEVLVSLVILAISLLAMAGLMTTTTKNNSTGGRVTEAATFAQDKLEELRAVSWASILLLQNSAGVDSKSSRPGVQFNRRWRASEVDPVNPNPNSKLLEVIITWSDATNHSLNFSSVLSNPNPT